VLVTNHQLVEEQFLIEGLKNRNKIVFDFIFAYYYSGLCAFANRFLNDKAVAEDLVQDFFVLLWEDYSRIQIRTSLKSYLFISVKNRCLDVKKHHQAIEKYRTFILNSSNNGGDDGESFLTESELRQAVQMALQKLTPRCREIFEMSRIQGLSNQVISEQLEISKRTVELQISNALKILRIELADILPAWLIIWLLR
jgi:RNA polymerase sigma-70 factor, ECF subfamily